MKKYEEKIQNGIPPAFMIFDELIQDEKAEKEDCYLYFYPEQFPIDQKLWLMGGIIGMIAFMANFIEDGVVEVAKCGKIKIAIRKIGDYVFALTGSIQDSDNSIKEHLSDIESAFYFNFGGVNEAIKGCEDRSSQKIRFTEIGERLLPLVHNYHNNKFKAFNALPYTQLPPNSNRIILGASQILNLLRRDKENIAGCIYKIDEEETPTVVSSPMRSTVNNVLNSQEKTQSISVICTHLEISTTRWINYLIKKKTFFLSNTSSTTNDLIDDHYTKQVFMSKDSLSKLRTEKALSTSSQSPFMSNSFENTSFSTSYQEEITSTLVIDESDNELHKIGDQNSENENVGLFFFHVQDLVLVLLTEFGASLDERHFKKMKLSCENKLDNLSKELKKCEQIKSKTKLMDNVAVLDNQIQPNQEKSIVSGTSSSNMLISRSSEQNTGNSDKNFHFVSFDNFSLTALATKPPKGEDTIPYSRFNSCVNQMHDDLKNDEKVHTIVVQDFKNSVFCCKRFSNELYFQQKHQFPRPNSYGFEIQARNTILNNFNVDML